MQNRQFGETGAEVAVIGQGTWNMELDDRDAAIRAIQRGVDEGMTHVDTAEIYGAGVVESLVGKALRGRRGKVFLTSKVSPGNASFEGTIAACERSLERLATDHLDLYLLHWPSQVPLEQTLSAFEMLVARGKIRFWGVSNFNVGEMEQLVAIAGQGRIACNQVLYNLEQRYVELELLGWCERHGIAAVAYSPLGSGHFPSPESAKGRVLQAVAEAHAATARQVALSYLVGHRGVFAIPKSSRADHTVENAGAASLQLREEEIRQIDEAFPFDRSQSELPFL